MPQKPSGKSSLNAAETIQPGQSPGDTGGTSSEPAFAPASGQRFGRYELREAIGAGAMGMVYRAWHTDLQHEVALKVPKLDGPNVDERKERFYREARSAVMLRHENICRVFDLDEVDGQLFIAMEFVDGKPLSSFVRPEQPLSEKKAAVIVRRLALALAHAHEHGVVHRDLKPDNIMISAKTKQPIVMDFGLVQLNRDGLSQDSSELTGEGSLMGTPLYMSPEQVEADPEKIGPQTDIYSLGVILYELLCGRVPFEGPVGVVIASVLTKEPEPLSQRQPGVTPGLVRICERMMAKKRDERYGSMQEVAMDLQKFLKGQIPEKTSSSGSSESWQVDAAADSPKRKPWPIIGGVVGAILLLVAMAFLFGGGSEAPNDESIANAPELPSPTTPSAAQGEEPGAADVATIETDTVALSPEETVVTPSIERRIRVGVDAPVHDFAWFPDSRRVLTCDRGAQLRIWNVATGELERTLALYESMSDCQLGRTAISPDGRRIVAILYRDSRDRRYQIGDFVMWENFQFRGVVAQHSHSTGVIMRAVIFAPDSRHFASMADDGTARMWDAETGEAVKTFEHRKADNSPAWVYDGHFSSDGKQLVTCANDGLVHVWNVETGEEVSSYAGHGAPVYSAAFMGDGRIASACTSDPWVRVWNPDNPDAEEKFYILGEYKRVSVTPDGRCVAVVTRQFHNIALIDLLTGQRQLLRGSSQPLTHGKFSPDGSRMCAISQDRFLSSWKIRTTPKTQSPPEPVDILSTLNLATDTSQRGWQREPDGSVTAAATSANIHAAMRCPLRGAGAYRLATEFTVQEAEPDSRFSLTLPVGTSLGTLVLGPRHPDIGHLEKVVGGAADPWPMLEIGRRYKLEAVVTPNDERAHIEVLLDGETLIDWRGDIDQVVLGPSSTFRWSDVAVCLSPFGGLKISFHRMTIQSDESPVVRAPLRDSFLKQRQKLARPDYADLATGQWQPVLNTPESIADLPGVSLTSDGVEVEVTKAYSGFVIPGVEGRDVIFRTRVKDSTGLHYLKFNVRCQFDPKRDRWPGGGGLLETGYASGLRRVKLFNSGLGSGNTAIDTLCEQVAMPPYEVAFAAIGGRLMAYINGHLVNELPTSAVSVAPQNVGMGFRKTQKAAAKLVLEAPEVMLLDTNVSAPAERIGGLYFDGARDYAEVDGLTYDGSEPITIECWSTLLGPHGGLLLLVSNQNTGGMNVRAHSDLWLTAAAGKDNFSANRSLQTPAVVGKRTHVAVTYGDGQYSLFVDGRLVQRETLNHPHIPSTLPFRIGNDSLPHSGHRCQALVHSVRFSRGIRYVDDFTPEETLASDADTLSLHGPRVQGEEWVDQSYRGHPAFIHGARPAPDAICTDPTGNESDRGSELLKIEHNSKIHAGSGETSQLALAIDRSVAHGFLRADLVGLPDGVTCLPVIIAPQVNSTRLKVEVAADAIAGDSRVKLVIRSAKATVVKPIQFVIAPE